MVKAKKLIVAHRGFSEKYPGNSWKAIKSSFEVGADICEIDLHLTKDEKILIYHDYYINNKRIREQTLEEIRKFTSEYPTLDEIIDWASKKRKKFILEVKDDAVLEPLSQLLKSNGAVKDLFIVASFDAVFLENFKIRNPDIKTCLILGNVLKPDHIVQLSKDIKVNFLIPAWENRHPYPDQLLSDDLIEKLNSENIKIISWHEERKEILKNLIGKPIYAISTNNPLLVKKLLRN